MFTSGNSRPKQNSRSAARSGDGHNGAGIFGGTGRWIDNHLSKGAADSDARNPRSNHADRWLSVGWHYQQ